MTDVVHSNACWFIVLTSKFTSHFVWFILANMSDKFYLNFAKR